jgi:predicted GIY-YIG superfamily endonuclease
MADLVLKNNVFEFNKEYFLQTSGTAIGTKMAPAYANIFMSILERDLLNAATHKPDIYHRFIDDIYMVWTHGEEKLLEFLDFINSARPTINFTSEYSDKSINFLDVKVSISENGEISTDLYTKPTDTHQYLQADSCHPNHIKKSIPYSQALRILRICSDMDTAKERCGELTNNLTKRGYSKKKVEAEIKRAITNFTDPPPPRENTGKRIFFTTDYHPALPNIKGILRDFLPVLHESERMQEVLPSLPTMSFRQPGNLKKSLCRAKLRQPDEMKDDRVPARSCGKTKCKICDILVCCDSITGASNQKQFKCRNRNSTCDSLWVIYVISCPDCQLQYVGQTNNFRLRMNGHKSDFRLYGNGRTDKTEAKVLYAHLAAHNRNSFNVQIVDYIDSRERTKEQLHRELDKREREWIWKLDTRSPKGLNTDDGFYSQNKKTRNNTNRS